MSSFAKLGGTNQKRVIKAVMRNMNITSDCNLHNEKFYVAKAREFTEASRLHVTPSRWLQKAARPNHSVTHLTEHHF